jgi:hypothetical protein
MTGANHVSTVALEAIGIALGHGQGIFRIVAEDSPVDIIAFDRIGMTLITAVRSRRPVNDAHTAMKWYSGQFTALVSTAQDIPCNRAMWFNSRPHGWVWYEATSGGLARMDDPFMPMIRYTWGGSAVPRSAVHPIRMPEAPESRTVAANAPVQAPAQGSISIKKRH